MIMMIAMQLSFLLPCGSNSGDFIVTHVKRKIPLHTTRVCKGTFPPALHHGDDEKQTDDQAYAQSRQDLGGSGGIICMANHCDTTEDKKHQEHSFECIHVDTPFYYHMVVYG
jgi:hypothetical protein